MHLCTVNAEIYIDGNIGPSDFFSGENSFSLATLNEKLSEIGEVETLDVFINSGGGSVTEGFAIHDKLKSLPFTVNTIANGMVGSIATVIFQANTNGGKRRLFENSEFFVHNPIWIPSGPNAMEAKDLELLHEDLKKAQGKLVDFYSKVTGKSSEELSPILDRQTTLSPSEAIELGFADEVITSTINAFTKYKIAAYYPINNNKTETMSDVKKELSSIKKTMETILAKVGIKFQNKSLTTNAGEPIYYEGDGEIVVGTKVFKDEAMTEALPSGDYEFENTIFVVVDGEVTEVKAKESIDALKAEIENLKSQLQEQIQAKEEKEAVIAETGTQVLALKAEIDKFQKTFVTGKGVDFGGSQFQGRKPEASEEKETPLQAVARKKREEREAREKK